MLQLFTVVSFGRVQWKQHISVLLLYTGWLSALLLPAPEQQSFTLFQTLAINVSVIGFFGSAMVWRGLSLVNKSCGVWISASFVLANMQAMLMQRLGNGLLLRSCKIRSLCAAPTGIFASFLAVVLHAEEPRLLSKCLPKFSIVTSTSKSVVCPKPQSRQLSDCEWSLVLLVLHYLWAALLSRTPTGTSSSQHCTFFSCLLSEE